MFARLSIRTWTEAVRARRHETQAEDAGGAAPSQHFAASKVLLLLQWIVKIVLPVAAIHLRTFGLHGRKQQVW